MKVTYEIGWAYPSSDHARKFGHGEGGCWVLLRIDGHNPPEAIAYASPLAERLTPTQIGATFQEYGA